MNKPGRRSTIYIDPSLHQALRVKAAHSQCTISDLVNDALRVAMQEDMDDLAAIEDRRGEPTVSYEELLKDLRAHGKI